MSGRAGHGRMALMVAKRAAKLGDTPAHQVRLPLIPLPELLPVAASSSRLFSQPPAAP